MVRAFQIDRNGCVFVVLGWDVVNQVATDVINKNIDSQNMLVCQFNDYLPTMIYLLIIVNQFSSKAFLEITDELFLHIAHIQEV